MTPAAKPLVEIRAISKQFPGALANDDVSLDIAAGEIRAIVGENGAGKSTLMRIVYGLEQPDSGSMTIDGANYAPRSALDAIAAGVGMVHQHFKLFPSLSVAENISFGAELTDRRFLDRQRTITEVRELSERYGLEVDPRAKVGDLPVGVRQRAELLKALWRDAKVLILDEPTAVLTPHEVDQFLDTVATLSDAGRSVVLVTHKLREVMAIADTVTVMRQGRVVADVETARTTPEEIARHMIGREPVQVALAPATPPGESVLDVRNVDVAGRDRRLTVRNVSFTVRAGEIVGLAGVSGNGQRELVEAIVGQRRQARGSIEITDPASSDPSFSATNRVAHIPDDRLRDGSAPHASVAENLAMGQHRMPALRNGPWIDRGAVTERATSIVEEYDVRTAGVTSAFDSLSGGNQQKAVVGRELRQPGPLVIAEQPTRGVDVGAIELIHERLRDARVEHRAVLLVSAELTELMALCDRVLVMFDGSVVGEVAGPTYDDQEIGAMMVGLTAEGS